MAKRRVRPEAVPARHEPVATDGASAIFFHSLWRSGSTSIFDLFRRQAAGFTSFQESIHEAVYENRENAEALLAVGGRPMAEALRHPALAAPYFQEVVEVNAAWRDVVTADLAYTRFFSRDGSQEAAFFRAVMSAVPGRAFFQECRTAHRIAAIKHEVGGFHLYGVRNPRDQWWSFKVSNYFDAALQLAISSPSVPDAVANLRAIVGFRPAPAGADTSRIAWYARNPLGHVDGYTAFYTLWCLCLCHAAAHADVIVDLDRLSFDSSYRALVSATISAQAGPSIDFSEFSLPSTRFSESENSGMAEIEARVHADIFRNEAVCEAVLRREAPEALQSTRAHHAGEVYRSVVARLENSVHEASALRAELQANLQRTQDALEIAQRETAEERDRSARAVAEERERSARAIAEEGERFAQAISEEGERSARAIAEEGERSARAIVEEGERSTRAIAEAERERSALRESMTKAQQEADKRLQMVQMAALDEARESSRTKSDLANRIADLSRLPVEIAQQSAARERQLLDEKALLDAEVQAARKEILLQRDATSSLLKRLEADLAAARLETEQQRARAADRLRESADLRTQENQRFSDVISRTEAAQAEVERQRQALVDELARLKTELSDANASFEAELAGVKKQAAASIQAMSSSVARGDRIATDLRRELVGARLANDRVTALLSSRSAHIQELEQSRTSLQSELATHRQTLADVQAKLDQQRNAAVEAARTAAQEERMRAVLTKDLATARTSLLQTQQRRTDELVRLASDGWTRMQALGVAPTAAIPSALDAPTASIRRLDDLFVATAERLAANASDADRQDTRLAEARNEADQLTSRLAGSDAMLVSTRGELHEMVLAQRVLQSSLDSRNADVQDLRRELDQVSERLSAERDSLAATIRAMGNEVDTLVSEKLALQSSLDIERKEHHDARGLVSTVQHHLAPLHDRAWPWLSRAQRRSLNALASLQSRPAHPVAPEPSRGEVGAPMSPDSSSAGPQTPAPLNTMIQGMQLAISANPVAKPELTADDFVQWAYRIILGRLPDESGRSLYVARLNKGVPRFRILSDLARSKEARQRGFRSAELERALLMFKLGLRPELPMHLESSHASPAEGPASTLYATDLLRYEGADFVENAFQRILGRPADKDGAHYFLTQLVDGADKESVLLQILNSPEGRGRLVRIEGLAGYVKRRARLKHPVTGWFWRIKELFRSQHELNLRLRRLESRAVTVPTVASERATDFESQVPALQNMLDSTHAFMRECMRKLNATERELATLKREVDGVFAGNPARAGMPSSEEIARLQSSLANLESQVQALSASRETLENLETSIPVALRMLMRNAQGERLHSSGH